MQSIELSNVERAIRSVGTQKAVAEALGVQQATVSRWKKSGRVPPERVLALEAISGIHRSVLRPDIYPPNDA